MSNDYVQKKCYCNPSLDKSSFLGTKSMQTSPYMKPFNRATVSSRFQAPSHYLVHAFHIPPYIQSAYFVCDRQTLLIPLNRADSVTVEAEGEQKRRDEEKGEKENKDDAKVKKRHHF